MDQADQGVDLQAAATADMTTGEIGEVSFILFVTIISYPLFLCARYLACGGTCSMVLLYLTRRRLRKKNRTIVSKRSIIYFQIPVTMVVVPSLSSHKHIPFHIIF